MVGIIGRATNRMKKEKVIKVNEVTEREEVE